MRLGGLRESDQQAAGQDEEARDRTIASTTTEIDPLAQRRQRGWVLILHHSEPAATPTRRAGCISRAKPNLSFFHDQAII
jgi:hypothetical protein